MSAVYSVNLGRAIVVGSASTTLFTVPPGKVAVLRDVRMRANPGTDATSVQVYINDGSNSYTIYEQTTLPADSTAQNDGRVVLEAGWDLRCHTSAGTVSFVASGYLLSAP